MPSRGRRAARLVRGVALAPAALLLALAVPRIADAGPPAIQVERASFWYDRPAPSPDADAEADAAEPSAPGCVDRLVAALDAILHRHAADFPQPPPIATVIRAVAREDMRRNAVWSSTIGSYGCATLQRGVVVIEIAPTTFVGRDALNDAELRSFLAHELLHAYQFAQGDHGRRPEEIARREVAALDWELAHLEPEVRAPYRDDLEFNRRMYVGMLAE